MLKKLLSISLIALCFSEVVAQDNLNCSSFFVSPKLGVSHRFGTGQYHGREIRDRGAFSFGVDAGCAKQFAKYKGIVGLGYEKLGLSSYSEELFPTSNQQGREVLYPGKPYYGKLLIPESESYHESFHVDFHYVNLSIGGQTTLTEHIALGVLIRPAYLYSYREQIIRETERNTETHSMFDTDIRGIQRFNIFSDVSVSYRVRTEQRRADIGLSLNTSWLSVLINSQEPKIYPLNASIFVRSYL